MSRSPAARRLATYARLTALGLLTVLALAAVPAAPVTAAAPQADPSISELQQALDQLVEDGAPGALLYTYDHGRVTELQSGVADIAAETPMSGQDHYRIGSLTKTYVSTAVLDLVAEHRIRLKDPVKRYLPGFLNGGPRVTIRQLLNHTSGLYEFNDDPRVLAPYLKGDLAHVWTPQQLVRIALTHDSVSAPGAEYHYSNTNYLLAGLLVQAVTGHRWPTCSSTGCRAGPPGGDDLHHVDDPARSGGTRVLRVRRRGAFRHHRPLPLPLGFGSHSLDCPGRRALLPQPALGRPAAEPTDVGDADHGRRVR